MKFIAFLLIITCILAGCSGTGLVDCDGNWAYNPDDFTEEQQIWIQNSAMRWNNWVGYTVAAVHPGKQHACIIHAGKTDKPTAIGQLRKPEHSITVNLERMKLLKILNQAAFEGVVMHEIGHSLGYDHIENGQALMAPAGAQDFTELDRIQCIKIGMCTTLNVSDNDASKPNEILDASFPDVQDSKKLDHIQCIEDTCLKLDL